MPKPNRKPKVTFKRKPQKNRRRITRKKWTPVKHTPLFREPTPFPHVIERMLNFPQMAKKQLPPPPPPPPHQYAHRSGQSINWDNFNWKNSASVNSLLKITENKIIYGKFWMDGCPHCVAIIGIWNAVVGKMREQHKNYFNIDVERENADIATEFLKKNKGAVGLEVSSFPTIYVIKSGKTFFYNGERTVENIVNWIIQPEKNYI